MNYNEHCKDVPSDFLYEMSGSLLDILALVSVVLFFVLIFSIYREPSIFLFTLSFIVLGAFIGRILIHGYINKGLHTDIADGQVVSQVISFGPYKLIRHPWYFVDSLFALTMLLFLMYKFGIRGSAFLIFFYIFIYRIKFEEQFLSSNFPEYKNYCQRVRYRILPRVI